MSDMVGYTNAGTKAHLLYRNRFGVWLTSCTSRKVVWRTDRLVKSEMCMRCWPKYPGDER